MSSMIDFVNENADVPLSEKPFCDIDRLILTQLSYLNFERIDTKKFVSLKTLVAQSIQLSEGNYREKKNFELFNLVASSKRYENLKVGDVACKMTDEVQFCAMTFKLDSHKIIVFRGTDMSIAGWKEDLNIGLTETIPSYKYGLDYTKKAMKNHFGKFELMGHSKGGNVALYVAINIGKKGQDKIKFVYNFDGPGFNSNILDSQMYKRIESKHKKFIPQDDVVGLLLNHTTNYTVIESKSFGFFQHDLYFWQVEGDSLKQMEDITFLSKILSDALLEWIKAMTLDEKFNLLRVLDEFCEKAKITDFNQFRINKLSTIKDFLVSYIDLPFKDKRMLFKLMIRLMKFYIGKSYEEIKEKFNFSKDEDPDSDDEDAKKDDKPNESPQTDADKGEKK